MTLEEIERRVLACRACPIARNPVPGDGPAPADVMFVGQAPGKVENSNRITFSGPAGTLLREILASLGYPVEEWYFTNSVKCFPGGGTGGDKVPPAIALEMCTTLHLEAEIAVVQPKLIVAVGAFTMRAFGIQGGINQNAGQVFDTQWGRVMCALHPAGIMRRHKQMADFRTQFYRIQTELDGPAVVPPFGLYSSEPILGVDIETQDDKIWCVGMADHQAKNAAVFPSELGEPFIALTTPGKVPVFHNAKFDISYLEEEGA